MQLQQFDLSVSRENSFSFKRILQHSGSGASAVPEGDRERKMLAPAFAVLAVA